MENVTYSVLLVLGIITAAILFIWLFFTIYHTLMALEFRREYGVAIPAGLYIKKAKKYTMWPHSSFNIQNGSVPKKMVREIDEEMI